MAKRNFCKHGYDKREEVPCRACKDPEYVPKKGWLFYVARPCYIVVKGTYAQAVAARKAALEEPMDGEYVSWFDGIPNVDRAGTNDDPCEQIADAKGIGEY